jgi:hypothetical protein
MNTARILTFPRRPEQLAQLPAKAWTDHCSVCGARLQNHFDARQRLIPCETVARRHAATKRPLLDLLKDVLALRG